MNPPAPIGAELACTDRLAEIRDLCGDTAHTRIGTEAVLLRVALADWTPALLTAVEDTVGVHEPMPMYGPADACPHPEPDNDASDAWHDWDDQHPCATYPDDVSGERVCLARPTGAVYCRTCRDEDGDLQVDYPCPTVQAVTAALTHHDPAAAAGSGHHSEPREGETAWMSG